MVCFYVLFIFRRGGWLYVSEDVWLTFIYGDGIYVFMGLCYYWGMRGMVCFPAVFFFFFCFGRAEKKKVFFLFFFGGERRRGEKKEKEKAVFFVLQFCFVRHDPPPHPSSRKRTPPSFPKGPFPPAGGLCALLNKVSSFYFKRPDEINSLTPKTFPPRTRTPPRRYLLLQSFSLAY